MIGSTALIALTAGAIAVAATVTISSNAPLHQLAPPQITPAGPIVTATGMLPGDHRESTFTVENPNGDAADVWISGRPTGGSRMLHDALIGTITSASTGQRWTGPLWELNASRVLDNLGGRDSERFTFDLYLPPWVGDEYKTLRSEFSLDFTFVNAVQGVDRQAPRSTILTKRPSRKVKKRRSNWLIRGTAYDENANIASVKLSLIRVVKRSTKSKSSRKSKRRRSSTKRGSSCATWVAGRKRMIRVRGKSCKNTWFSVTGKEKWHYRIPLKRLQPGLYLLMSRAVDTAGNVESTISVADGNSASFRITKKTRSHRKR